ncbi:sulfatase family protein [Aureibacter tunicatorum]|uniref:Arylsulfatase A-like enzyme n=1 Tax=Aureibacter tunicatorum TaxID=866807 RepID=A0AAE4BVJ0_9BACT|nr:arylsulfatase [Aureibacter tunicatorum]MDR6241768.1 arylsulfatase A-like enzyme [Aureibacter tunicatorum]
MKKTTIFLLGTSFGLTMLDGAKAQKQIETPNILLIYLDDLGYGDMSAYGFSSLETPNMDKIANEGVRFVNGYATSATSTPSRYGLLTGIYPWRQSGVKILRGNDSMLIDKEQMTLARMLKQQGYRTGIVGKWHLGLGDDNSDLDWNAKLTASPNDLGFDYSYIMAATQDRVPTIYIRNGEVVNLNSENPIYVDYEKKIDGCVNVEDHPEKMIMHWSHGHNNSIVNGIPRIGYMKGGDEAIWDDYDLADNFLKEAENFILNNDNQDTPFFLFYAMHQPHVPRTPHPRFEGLSGMGPRGDAILEADWCIGDILKLLKEEGVLENTLIIFSSDNGPVLDDGYHDNAVEMLGDHKPFGDLRGGKYSLYEAGTRVPLLTYWKGITGPKVSEALVSQVDIFASLACLTGSSEKAIDSQNMLDVFLGRSDNGRKNLMIESQFNKAYRSEGWVLIPPHKGRNFLKKKGIETGISNEYQLYNIIKDPGQKLNLAKSKTKVLKKMINEYESLK